MFKSNVIELILYTDEYDLESLLKHTCRKTGNFGGKIFCRIAENMSFGGIYFGG